MPHYFAYGSNLVTAQLKRRCPTFSEHPRVIGVAALAGYRLTFPVASHGDWGGGVAGLGQADPTQTVYGVVFELDEQALAHLDLYEGVDDGMYHRLDVTVELAGGGARPCVTYQAIPDPDGPYLPSRRYLSAIIAGAREHGLPADYIRRLEQLPTLDS